MASRTARPTNAYSDSDYLPLRRVIGFSIHSRTMPALLEQFHQNVTRLGDAPCWQYKDANGAWCALSWREVAARVRVLTEWLVARGLQPGDCVAIMGSTRWEWSLADLAVVSAGGVTVPVYHTLPFDQASFIINEPACRWLVAERALSPTFASELKQACPALEGIIYMEAGVAQANGTLPVWHLPALLAAPPAADVAAYDTRWRARKPTDLISLVYTSGTTGRPKGVELTLDNFTHEVRALQAIFHFRDEHVGLMFLPLAHIVGRVLQFFQLWVGCTGAYAEGIDKLGDNIRETRPHFFAAVPRVYEKIQSRLQHQVTQLPPLKQKLFRWALRVGARAGACAAARQPVPLAVRMQHAVARKILAPVHTKMGGRLLYVISGGAPLARETAEFFHALGLLILEGYGMTETSGAVAINHPDDFRFGTVGRILDGVEVRMADDGEICLRGPVILRGYYQRPDDNAALFTADGWFHTGDIGELQDGFLRITDRKKDLIKTSGGKYVAPQPIENRLKQSPYISDAIVHGDRRKYVTALVTLDPDAVTAFAREHDFPADSWDALVRNPKIVELVQAAIDKVNGTLASFETIKQFRILPQQFAMESGELTPTMKVKRAVAYDRYKNLFEQMYQE